MRYTERLVIAALLAFAVVSGAQTADPAEPGTTERQIEELVGGHRGELRVAPEGQQAPRARRKAASSSDSSCSRTGFSSLDISVRLSTAHRKLG